MCDEFTVICIATSKKKESAEEVACGSGRLCRKYSAACCPVHGRTRGESSPREASCKTKPTFDGLPPVRRQKTTITGRGTKHKRDKTKKNGQTFHK
jgi:hypothetical protein